MTFTLTDNPDRSITVRWHTSYGTLLRWEPEHDGGPEPREGQLARAVTSDTTLTTIRDASQPGDEFHPHDHEATFRPYAVLRADDDPRAYIRADGFMLALPDDATIRDDTAWMRWPDDPDAAPQALTGTSYTFEAACEFAYTPAQLAAMRSLADDDLGSALAVGTPILPSPSDDSGWQ